MELNVCLRLVSSPACSHTCPQVPNLQVSLGCGSTCALGSRAELRWLVPGWLMQGKGGTNMAALELVAMDMKAQGMYVCRTLSFAGACGAARGFQG
jgi:hypothetical protein